MHASLRRSERAEGAGLAQKERLGSALLERGGSPAPFPWAVASQFSRGTLVHLVAKQGQGKSNELFLEVAGFPKFSRLQLEALF